LQPRRAARRYLRVRGTARADPQRPGVGLAPRPQALPKPAAAPVLYFFCGTTRIQLACLHSIVVLASRHCAIKAVHLLLCDRRLLLYIHVNWRVVFFCNSQSDSEAKCLQNGVCCLQCWSRRTTCVMSRRRTPKRWKAPSFRLVVHPWRNIMHPCLQIDIHCSNLIKFVLFAVH
jgi:hypothetical protein